MRRPFHKHSSSRLDALIEAKAKQGVQVNNKTKDFHSICRAKDLGDPLEKGIGNTYIG